jgi:hypothetical protein
MNGRASAIATHNVATFPAARDFKVEVITPSVMRFADAITDREYRLPVIRINGREVTLPP